MKIIFKRKVPHNIDKPFGIYQYDELVAQNPCYIDIRGIVRKKTWVWLDEIQSSHANVARAFLRYTRWWWVTPMSRLDVRPWGQAYLLKPLFFAKAVLEWRKSNPNIDEILLIGCDPLVAVYLKEFDKTLTLQGDRRILQFLFFVFQGFKSSMQVLRTMLKTTCYLIRYHIFKTSGNVDSKVIVLYEFVFGHSFVSAHEYFYKSLFDSVSDDETNTIGYACISPQGPNMAEIRTEFVKDRFSFFLLDNITMGDLIIAIFSSIYCLVITLGLVFRRIPCSIEKSFSNLFWPNYLLQELGRGYYLKDICCYRALKTIFKQSECRLVIYPYEEKCIERAILFAAQEHDVNSIGYTPHPQYRLALALRDNFSPLSSKPSKYAVCGPAYIDYFVSWGKKNRNSIKVWGSGKYSKNKLGAQQINRFNLTVLVLLSHPNELKVFYSWLRAEKRIASSITYLIRVYKAVKHKGFEQVLTPLMREFDCVKKTQGTLIEDLNCCDLVVFCATSAGLVAVNSGYLSIYVDLNDCFQINPCFDDLNVMLHCRSSSEFAARLDQICAMTADSIKELHQRQLSFVEKVFSPIQTSVIKEELSCYTA